MSETKGWRARPPQWNARKRSKGRLRNSRRQRSLSGSTRYGLSRVYSGGEDADGNKRSKTHELPMSRTTLGRKRPRKMAELIDEWLKGERDSLRIEESSGVSPKGIICIILGIFSLLFCIILGQFADPKPVRKKR